MNTYQVEHYLRRRLEEMPNAEFDLVSRAFIEVHKEAAKHIEHATGRKFGDVFAERLAKAVKGQPADMKKMKQILPFFPELAACLVPHFPDDPWIKKVAAQTAPVTAKRKSFNHYIEQAIPRRDAAEDRWRALKAKVDNGTATASERIGELIAYAELYAGANILSARDPVEVHLREQRIDAIASLLARISVPTAGAGDPVK